jgi:hypothetical protein
MFEQKKILLQYRKPKEKSEIPQGLGKNSKVHQIKLLARSWSLVCHIFEFLQNPGRRWIFKLDPSYALGPKPWVPKNCPKITSQKIGRLPKFHLIKTRSVRFRLKQSDPVSFSKRIGSASLTELAPKLRSFFV